MSMNKTPAGERTHIGILGRRNVGKSTLMNALTGQQASVVSPTKGTTTDPVRKAMELLPLGPVLFLDTPGYDDTGALGALRVSATQKVLAEIELALLVFDGQWQDVDQKVFEDLQERKIPTILVYNQPSGSNAVPAKTPDLVVNALTGEGILALREAIPKAAPASKQPPLVQDLIQPGDTIILVVPIDESAPKGRLILPQQQVIRDALEVGALVQIVQPAQLPGALEILKDAGCAPALVITDSQVFPEVDAMLPKEIPLTSFSILMSRRKGTLQAALDGVKAIDNLKDGDKVLIAEGCTHHRMCQDIGTVKIPRWLQNCTGKDVEIHTASGKEFPEDVSPYSVIIHCGGCMLNGAEVSHRCTKSTQQGVPFLNYGIFIAYANGILPRCVAALPIYF